MTISAQVFLFAQPSFSLFAHVTQGDFATVKGDSEVRNMVQCDGGKSRVVVDHVRIYTMEMEIFMRSDKASHERGVKKKLETYHCHHQFTEGASFH